MKTVYWKKTGSMAVLTGILLGTVVIYQDAISTQRSSPTPNMKEKVENGTKFILYYTPFFGASDWNIGIGRDPFIANKCPVNKCYITSDPTTLSDLNQFDALLFHVWETKGLPDQSKRLPHQR